MDFDALDNISMAGARFDWIKRRGQPAWETRQHGGAGSKRLRPEGAGTVLFTRPSGAGRCPLPTLKTGS